MNSRAQRLSKFYGLLINDEFVANDANEAYAFLKRHLDSVEKAAIPEEKHGDYTIRMNIPSFSIPESWVRTGKARAWEATKHIIRIWDNGNIEIRTKS